LIAERLAPALADARTLMAGLGLAWAADDAALRAFAAERIAEAPVTGCWLVRAAPGAPLPVQMRGIHAAPLLAVMLAVRAAIVALTLLMWWFIGPLLLGGELTDSSLVAGALCLLAALPLQLLDAWTQSRLALDAGALLKRALLAGLLRLDRGHARAHGVGKFMSMAMEGEVSATAMETVLMMLAALVDLLAALGVLLLGTSGPALAGLLVAWLGLTAWLCRRYAEQADRWATAYRDITQDVIERMVGYQTRLVQEPIEQRHLDEDPQLRDYLRTAQEFDRRGLVLGGPLRSGWLLLGIGALAPTLMAGGDSAATTAVALGGVLLASQALGKIVGGVVQMVDVLVSWRQTAPILAAGRAAWTADAALRSPPPAREDAPLLQFSRLSVRHAPDRPEALRGCTQQILRGDRVLLAGPSGGGKSTLATVLAGLRAPDSGVLRLSARDRSEVTAEAWRRRVVLVPQFHDNHILTDSLLFNLLLGRRWPPTAADTKLAAQVCDLLGLTPVLQRMPQGLQQTVGDGGWALSHGERSRVFLARALLQEGVALVILDESFAALDPETLREVGAGVLASAPTLLVISHD
jgi:ATP-binding cassette subfamily B protein